MADLEPEVKQMIEDAEEKYLELVGDLDRRTCVTCKEYRPCAEFEGKGRKCVGCRNAGVARCTRCDQIKSVDDFYKGNASGKCRECLRAGRQPKVSGFAALPDNIKAGIIEDTRRCDEYKLTHRGEKMTYKMVCEKYGIPEATFSLWRRLDKLRMG